jgi:hypothetical protein
MRRGSCARFRLKLAQLAIRYFQTQNKLCQQHQVKKASTSKQSAVLLRGAKIIAQH